MRASEYDRYLDLKDDKFSRTVVNRLQTFMQNTFKTILGENFCRMAHIKKYLKCLT